MKRLTKNRIALVICGALNLGLTNDAQATEFDFSTEPSNSKAQGFSSSPSQSTPPPPMPQPSDK